MFQRDDIPLAEVLSATNDLVSEGIIKDYAIGGAIAAICYTEPTTTFDVDLFYRPNDTSLDAAIPRIFKRLQDKGWSIDAGHLLCQGFPVQFLVGSGLTAEAIESARELSFHGVRTRVFRPEYIIAIAAQVGRAKDHARIVQMLEQADFDRDFLRSLLKRFGLNVVGYDI